MTAPTRVVCSYPECGGECGDCAQAAAPALKVALDYVIRVSPAVPVSFLAHASDEDDGEPAIGPARTSDVTQALRFRNFNEARAEVRRQAAKWTHISFMLGVAAPLVP